MITGTVSPYREALIRLRVQGPAGQEEEIEAAIDTGFTDYLTLEPGRITALGLPYVAFRDAELADGSIVTLNVFKATVLWDGQPRDIQVFEADGGPLVGMAMLQGHRVTLDVVDGGSVTIETLP